MEKDYGEPLNYDPDFKGPIHNRSCTDIFWLLLFIVFLGGWGYVGYYSLTHGDVERLLAPMDSKGRRCGLDSDVMDKSYLVFFDISRCLSPGVPITGCPTPQVCVNQCPTETILFVNELANNPNSFQELKSKMICTEDIDINTMTLQQAIDNIQLEKCAAYVLQSQAVLFRCIGDLSTLKCKEGQKGSSMVSKRDGGICVRNPLQARTSLVNRATALDSYVGLLVASWVTFFTRNERDLHVVYALFINYTVIRGCMLAASGIIVVGRCFVNVNDAAAVFSNLNLTEDQLLEQLINVVKLNQLSAQIVEDLLQSRWYMLGGLFVVLVICFIYIILLRWIVGPVVWTSIIGLIALLGFSLYLCYQNYRYYLAHPVIMQQTTNLQGYAESIFSKHQTWLTLLIVLAVTLLILILMVIFLRKRITIAIAMIREGSKAVNAVKSTMAFPIFPWIIQCFVIAFGVVVLMYLLSIGESTFSVVNLQNDTSCNCQGVYSEDYKSCDPVQFSTVCRNSDNSDMACTYATCHFTGIDSPPLITYMHIINLVGFFWLMFFISGVSDMMLASTFSTWYWTFHKRNLPFFTLTSGIYRTLRYHLGTVALGSLIITIVRMIRIMLEYVDRKLKKFDNPFTRCVLCMCKCVCYCLENFLKFINKNAYIMCAVHGKSFCSSARDAFSLLMRNIVRVVVLDKVTDFIFFISKLLITIGVGIGVYYLMQWNYIYEVTQGTRLHHNYVPAIILAFATFLITTIFFNVYAMAVDTLFLCFLEDCERNDGSPEKPYFMSKNLMKILGKKNKIH